MGWQGRCDEVSAKTLTTHGVGTTYIITYLFQMPPKKYVCVWGLRFCLFASAPTDLHHHPSIQYLSHRFTMHGQKRSEYKSRLLHTETSLKLATKAKQWNHLNHELLTQHRRLLLLSSSVDGHGSSSIGKDDDDDDDIIAKTPPPSPAILLLLTDKMLSVNPDPSHLWNIRRELLLLLPLLQTKKETKDDDDDDDEDNNNAEDGKVATAITTFNIDKQLQEELKLTAHCLQRNPKSYATWHRK